MGLSKYGARLFAGLPFPLSAFRFLNAVLRRTLNNHINGALEARPCIRPQFYHLIFMIGFTHASNAYHRIT